MGPRDKQLPSHLVIGVGASADGVQALGALLSNLDEMLQASLILVQHIDLTGKALALEVLRQLTKLSVVEIKDGLKLEPAKVYVARPQTVVHMKNGALWTRPLQDHSKHLCPINSLFESLAISLGQQAAGVLLLGEGRDGPQGLRAISEAGGMTIAQEPGSAEHPSMLQSAVSTGVVDHILKPELIGEKLLAYERDLMRTSPEIGLFGGRMDIRHQRTDQDHSTLAIENERENFRNLFEQTPEMVCILRGPDHVFEFVNEAHIRTLGFNATGMAVREAQPESVEVHGLLDSVYQTGKTAELHEIPVTVTDRLRYFNLTYAARRDKAGTINGVLILGVEVTEQVLFREHLRESDEQLKFALSSAKMGSWTVKLPSNSVTLSDEALEIFGFAKEYDSTDAAIDEFIHPEDRDHVKQVLARALASGAPYSDEFRVQRPDGEVRWINSRGRARYDDSGTPILLSGVVMDVTERKLAEEARRYSEEMLKLALAAGEMGEWDLDLITGHAHRALMHDQCFGYQEPLPSWTYEDFLRHVHPDDRESVDQKFKAALAGGKDWQFECRVIWPDETIHWIAAAGRVTFGESRQPIRMAGLVHEITERKKAEEERERLLALEQKSRAEAQENLSKLHAVVQNLNEGMVFCDADGNLLLMNSEALRIHDFRSTQEMKKRIDEYPDLFVLQTAEGDELPFESWPINRVRRGERFSDYEVELSRRDTGKSWIASYGGAPVYDEDGKFLIAVLTVKDVTEKKRTENALKEAIRARDEFLSIASHELKTPLTSLRLQMQILGKQIAKGDQIAFDAAYLNNVSELAIRQTKQLSNLIDDMLDVSRIATGHLSFDFAEHDLASMVVDAYNSFSGQFQDAGVEAFIEAQEDLMVKADSHRMEQVFVNLLSNALKYGEKSPVRIQVRGDGRVGKVIVEDQGTGIAQENLERIFGRFERAISANSVSGLGLGLYVSRTIVEAHGGQIYARSKPGEGSKFIVEIPLGGPDHL